MEPSRAVWITGAGGLIGHQLVRSCPETFHPIGLHRSDLDLLDRSAVETRFRKEQPAAIIHCAAMSKSPACQADPALARKTNVEVTSHLASLAASIPFFFLSTDLVFDGSRGHYTETDPPHPLSIYGETKLEAEAQVRRNPGHTIIRTSLNGGRSPTGNRGFNEELQAAIQAGRSIHLFTDEFRNPMAAQVTAAALWELLARGATGTFHLAGADRLSRYEIGCLLVRHWGMDPASLIPGSIAAFKGPPRPPDPTLCCDKVQSLLSFPLPSFRAWLSIQTKEAF